MVNTKTPKDWANADYNALAARKVTLSDAWAYLTELSYRIMMETVALQQKDPDAKPVPVDELLDKLKNNVLVRLQQAIIYGEVKVKDKPEDDPNEPLKIIDAPPVKAEPEKHDAE